MEYRLRTTDTFDKWMNKLKDKTARRRILGRLVPIEQQGHFGDYAPLGEQEGKELFELRFFFGPGYRIYFTIRGSEVVLLLHGGDKASQSKDIAKARNLLSELE